MTTDCPVCAGGRTTPVLDVNSLVLLDEMRGSALTRYGYKLCHVCGVVFASQRPTGADYDFIYSRFNEFLGRPSAPDVFDDPAPLDDAFRAELDAVARPFWEVTPEAKHEANRYGAAALKYATVYQPHADIITSRLDPRGLRVLDVRSKTGYLAAAMKRAGADEVCATVMFPAQQYLIQRCYDVRVERAMNFETFEAPFPGDFDLIILTHMLTHATAPQALLAQVAARLRPGGMIYLCQDNDDTRLFTKGKNLVGEMKPFHFQQFDLASLRRAVERAGFEVIHATHARDNAAAMGLIARHTGSPNASELIRADLDARTAMYRQWVDESLVALPASVQRAVIDPVDLRSRALRNGWAVEKNGDIRPARKITLTHQQGFAQLNA